MKFSRRNLLVGGTAAMGAAAFGTRRASAEVSTVPRNLVLVIANGGWDTTYALDPKPGLSTIDGPDGTIVDFSGLPILTDPNRPAVDEFFTAYGARTALVRGVQTQSVVHSDCFKRVLTGTASDTNPDIGAITAFEYGSDLAAPYLVLGQTTYTGPFGALAAKAGSTNQLGQVVDPDTGWPVGSLTDPRIPLTMDQAEREMVRGYILGSAQQVQAVRGLAGSNKAKLQDYIDSVGRGDALRQIAAFGEVDYTRDLAVQANLAVTGLEQNLCWVAQLEAGDFDSHDNNLRQIEEHQNLFAGLKSLLDELAARPGKRAGGTMLDETVVAVISEMGRTPKLNNRGGKDHWPVTSALVVGAGVAGGRVIGATDDRQSGLAVDLQTGAVAPEGKQVQYGNLAAGLLSLVGVDPANYLPNSEPLDALQA